MMMYADILKIKEITKNEALYKVTAFLSKEYFFYVSINLTTKVVSFFNDEQQKVFLGDYNLNFPDKKINIQTIPKRISLFICRAASFAIQNQKLPDDISRAM